MAERRAILHLDMDAFFAAVEQLDDPALRGRPVLVGHDGPRGVVATASYEARPFGCRSAMPMAQARRLCPHAVVVPIRGGRYREVSRQIFTILEDFSPLVEPVSIDEAFVDLTGAQRLLGEPVEVARRIKGRIADETRLTASAGVSFNKFLAKLASDMDKPDGLTVIGPAQVEAVLGPLPVGRIWGIGAATAARLERLGIRTVAQLRAAEPRRLAGALGNEVEHFLRLARGEDERPVVTDRQAKSISHECTFEIDLADAEAVRRTLLDQVEQVALRLRLAGLKARGIALKIRFGDFQTISRSATLEQTTDATAQLWRAARELFDRWPFRPVRLIGFGVERLTAEAGQLLLFGDPDEGRNRRLDAVTDRINARYGKRAIRRGGSD